MKRNALVVMVLLVSFVGCRLFRPGLKEPKKEPAVQSAAEILSVHAIHDAVMVVPNGTWHSSPSLVDLDGDGDLEVVVVVGEGWMGAWHHDGRPVLGWPQKTGRVVCSPAIGDVDKDGKPEIAGPGYLWRADGTAMTGWPIVSANPFCTPSLDDVDGDGDLEILHTDLKVGMCVRHHDGTLLPGWPISVPDNDIRCTPLAEDVDGDGKKEIVFVRRPGEVRVYRQDGTPLSGFPKLIAGGQGWNSFVFSDVNRDGRRKVVWTGLVIDLMKGETSRMPGGPSGGNAPCLVNDPQSGEVREVGVRVPGQQPGRWDALGPFEASGVYVDSPVAADIDGDGQVEALFGNRKGGWFAIRPDGTQAAGWPKLLTPSGDCGMAVGDLDGDGYFDVVANAQGGRIYVFGCPGRADGAAPWPLFMANNLRNGTPVGAPRAAKRLLGKSTPASVEQLKKHLASGDWNSAIEVYRAAIASVENEPSEIGTEQSKQLEQAGLLSIARILNTRAGRFAEAAEFYRQAVEAAPHTWPACQALAECTDLTNLHLDIAATRDSLNGATTAFLAALDTGKTAPAPVLAAREQPPSGQPTQSQLSKQRQRGQRPQEAQHPLTRLSASEYDVMRLTAAQACMLLERKEATVLFQSVARSPETMYGHIAQNAIQYEGLPFLVSFEETRSVHVTSKAKDFLSNTDSDARTEAQLEIHPHSPTLEFFPMQLHLTAEPTMRSFLEGTWTDGPDGKIHQKIEKNLESGPLGLLRINRFNLVVRPTAQRDVTVRREVERIDERHMRVRIFFQSPLNQIEYGFLLDRTGARVDVKSVQPTGGIMYLNENEVRFAVSGGRLFRGGPNDLSPLASGTTVVATVEIPPGASCFYPEVMVRAWGGGADASAQPRTPTDRIHGSVEGVKYELSSSRRFKLRSPRTHEFFVYILERREANLP